MLDPELLGAHSGSPSTNTLQGRRGQKTPLSLPWARSSRKRGQAGLSRSCTPEENPCCILFRAGQAPWPVRPSTTIPSAFPKTPFLSPYPPRKLLPPQKQDTSSMSVQPLLTVDRLQLTLEVLDHTCSNMIKSSALLWICCSFTLNN